MTTSSLPFRADPARGAALLEEPAAPWILVPLGNPGEEYADTRHNLGRILLQRWLDTHAPRAGAVHTFATGTLYALMDPFLALVPGTYMNLSGQACAEARDAGFDPARFLVIHDDKDLPLGLGRLKLGGGDGGHNGLRSITECLGSDAYARLRLGIGPIQRPLHAFVLQPWTDPEWELLDTMDAPFAALMGLLASGRALNGIMSLVNAESFWRPRTEEPAS